MTTVGVVDAYAATAGSRRWDEMVQPHGRVRRAWRELGAVADLLGPAGLTARLADARRLLEDEGVTYRALGSDEEQLWGLDPLPVLLDGAEWAELEPALVQRAELLDRLLTDLYGPREVIRRGLLPTEIVHGHAGFIRSWDQVRIPGSRQLFLCCVDLARGLDGAWRVLGDRVQAPSGAGYAMENRRVVARVLPGLHRQAQIHRLGPFFHAMRLGLQEVAPRAAEAPRVVLLTPGTHSETAYEQAFLSSLLGYPLVLGSDLTVADGQVRLRSLGRLEPVDVILRRVDSWYCDPLDLRPDSQLGVPGLIEACRLGTVTVVNGLGSGVLENPGLLPFLPALAEALLNEPLLLESAQTWWCGDPPARQHVLARLPDLVIKPLSRGIGRSVVFGHELSAGERDELRRRIEAEPHAWVGQEPVALSTAPTVTEDGLEPRGMTLRAFTVSQGGNYRVMTGGLTRVAPGPDDAFVSQQVGAVAKDVWVLTTQGRPVVEPWVHEEPPAELRASMVSPRVAEDLFWLGRYAERAEDTARLLRAVADRWGDFQASEEPAGAEALSELLRALTLVTTTWPGFAGDAAADRLAAPRAELLSLVVDDRRPGTLAYAVRRLTKSAQEVREQLSMDTWLVLGGLERVLHDLAARARGAEGAQGVDLPGALARVLEGLLALAGLTAESLVRDAGWRFLDAGRRVERAQQVTSLLAATLVPERQPEVDSLVVESVLITAESIITYRRRYPAGAGVATVLDLLLTDRENPRAVAYQLDRLGEDLALVPGSGPTVEAVRARLLEVLARLRGADTAALAGPDAGGARDALGRLLADLARGLSDLAASIETAHFRHLAPQRPLDPYASVDAW